MMQSKNLSESIADKIKQRIIIGEYSINSRLPNEQELSESLNVSRTTIREAVKLLVSRHVLEIERGKGTFVAAIPGLSEDPFGLEFVPEDILKEDLCAFRQILEPSVCRLAAENASPQQINDMKQIVKKMAQISERVSKAAPDELVDIFIDQEIAFHTLLYKMSHNIIFERMSDIIARSVIINSTAQNYRVSFNFAKYTEIHTDLYKAIASGAASEAEARGFEHATTFAYFCNN